MVSEIRLYIVVYCVRELLVYECPCFVMMAYASYGASSEDFTSCVSYALSCLKKEHFVLKPEQSAALELVFQGKDVFIWFPTGFGKSTCYQALPSIQ